MSSYTFNDFTETKERAPVKQVREATSDDSDDGDDHEEQQPVEQESSKRKKPTLTVDVNTEGMTHKEAREAKRQKLNPGAPPTTSKAFERVELPDPEKKKDKVLMAKREAAKREKELEKAMKTHETDHPTRLSVIKLPNGTRTGDIKKFFAKCGAILDIKNKWGHIPDNDKLKDVALVTFKEPEGYRAGLGLDGTLLKGKKVGVKPVAYEKKAKQAVGARCLFVGNLNFNVEKEDVAGAFRHCGKVISVRLARDKETNKMKGFAFVFFEGLLRLKDAMKLNGEMLRGRPLVVSSYNEKEHGAQGTGEGAPADGPAGGQGGLGEEDQMDSKVSKNKEKKKEKKEKKMREGGREDDQADMDMEAYEAHVQEQRKKKVEKSEKVEKAAAAATEKDNSSGVKPPPSMVSKAGNKEVEKNPASLGAIVKGPGKNKKVLL